MKAAGKKIGKQNSVYPYKTLFNYHNLLFISCSFESLEEWNIIHMLIPFISDLLYHIFITFIVSTFWIISN